MLIPIILVGGIVSGIGAYCVMKSCSGREKKKGVSPYGAGVIEQARFRDTFGTRF